MNNNGIALTCSSITKLYTKGANTIKVLDDISIDILKGKITSIVGRSGAGKTTLLYVLSGLLAPSSGEINIDGNCLFKMDHDARAHFIRSNIGFVFQDYQLLSSLNSLENICLPLLLRGERYISKNIKDTVKGYFEIFEIGERYYHYPSELSGGEQQRVAIIRALIKKPSIIFFDEPTGSLDCENAENLTRIICKTNKTTNCTFVIASHDKKMRDISSQSFQMENGRLKF